MSQRTRQHKQTHKMSAERDMKTQDNTIIGLTGHARHGKDTIAAHLVQKYGYHHLSIAHPLKQVAKILYGLTDHQLFGDEKDTVDPMLKVTPRHILQMLGTNVLREHNYLVAPTIGQDLFVHCIYREIQHKLKENKDAKFVISDVRLLNELKFFQSTFPKFQIWRVVRPSLISSIKTMEKKDANDANDAKDAHITETALNHVKVDHEIVNDSTIAKLHEAVNNAMGPTTVE